MTKIQMTKLAPIGDTVASNAYNKLVSRLNDIHIMLGDVDVSDEFTMVYANLCGKVFELAGELNMASVWSKTGENKKLVALGDKMYLVGKEVDNAAIQVSYLVKNLQSGLGQSGQSKVFEFRRAA